MNKRPMFGPIWIVAYVLFFITGLVMCCYGYAAVNSDLYISGEANIKRKEKVLLDMPMNELGEANPGFVPTPAPFIDAVSGRSLAVTGDILHSTEQVKIGEQSGRFVGTAPQRLTMSNTALNFGTKDFTISFWTYLGEQDKLFPTFVSDVGNSQLQFFVADNNNARKISLSSGADRWLKTDTLYTEGKWMHYAVVRKGNVFTVYEDGVSIGSATSARRIDLTSFGIGGNSSLNTPLIGYLDDFAIYDYAKWESDFTPPTTPQTDANLLYIDFEEEMIDNTIYNNTPILEKVTGDYPTPAGTGAIRGMEEAEASGSAALYMAGVTGQSLSLKNDNLNFGTKDFTVSFWAKPDKQTTTTPLLFGNDGATGLKFYLANTGSSNRIALYNDNTILINTGQSYVTNTWAHYVIERCEGVFSIYQNGRKIGTTGAFANLKVDLSSFAIGGISTVATSAYKGYLDDFIIYDQAMYLQDFTPYLRK